MGGSRPTGQASYSITAHRCYVKHSSLQSSILHGAVFVRCPLLCLLVHNLHAKWALHPATLVGSWLPDCPACGCTGAILLRHSLLAQ